VVQNKEAPPVGITAFLWVIQTSPAYVDGSGSTVPPPVCEVVAR